MQLLTSVADNEELIYMKQRSKSYIYFCLKK